ncbi:hypothetical protein V496_07599 [Pseudogymnoascus sp. VKM F-4515 (FW-2607)]|nr:hypothetical protein V496_07599 [Pseudogymnoascus sp. VKM F-4515 (FW-2607)]KFY90275.1 hypothetical protein V498_06068 [Pseudogymnoascus sp. VKM F-4517 (FW-2822)]
MPTTQSNGQDNGPTPPTGVSLPSSKPEPSRYKKITFNGIEGVGKSSLITALIKQAVDTSSGGVPNEILPSTITNITELRRGTDGDQTTISFWEYSYVNERIAPIVYDRANILLYCFSLDFMGDVENHLEVLRWKLGGLCSPDFPCEISMPIFMVGCKSDSQDPKTIAGREGAKWYAKSLYLDGYFECSAVTGEGVPELLDAVMNIVVSTEKYTPRRRFGRFNKTWKRHRCVMS